jgi:hypothetical protein
LAEVLVHLIFGTTAALAAAPGLSGASRRVSGSVLDRYNEEVWDSHDRDSVTRDHAPWEGRAERATQRRAQRILGFDIALRQDMAQNRTGVVDRRLSLGFARRPVGSWKSRGRDQ